jgi:DNA-binding response OmpR family regulator
LKVLIVDDDPDVLRMTERFLASRGVEVHTSPSPFGVSSIVLNERPDVVVLDVMMPALGGEALARFLRSLPDDDRPAILFYSAMPAHDLAQIAARVPHARSIEKTAGLAALYAACLEAADQRH